MARRGEGSRKTPANSEALPELPSSVTFTDFVLEYRKLRRGVLHHRQFQRRDAFVETLANLCYDAADKADSIGLPEPVCDKAIAASLAFRGIVARICITLAVSSENRGLMFEQAQIAAIPFPAFLIAEMLVRRVFGDDSSEVAELSPDIRDWMDRSQQNQSTWQELLKTHAQLGETLASADDDERGFIPAIEISDRIREQLTQMTKLRDQIADSVNEHLGRKTRVGRKPKSKPDSRAPRVDLFFWNACGAKMYELEKLYPPDAIKYVKDKDRDRVVRNAVSRASMILTRPWTWIKRQAE